MSFLELQWSDGDRDYYSVKARRRNINLEPITMEYVEENMNKEDLKAQSAIIRCDKRVEILIHTDYIKVGGIVNGEFIAEEKDTFDFHNIFLR
ncbi:hypothetical protein INT47_000891 [Mucor saturninus]|uniref:Uncharacterized protein n=1 Tax=Mucor saturninus TaxID=64648 RepID=A0A8H7RPM1_9FUNG|nr:hypothetical protein INT47_000891 [Mucor saturninus]